MIRTQRSSGSRPPPSEVIDLTTSPSPPPPTRTRPSERANNRHAPYNARNRPSSRVDRGTRSPVVRPPPNRRLAPSSGAEVIDLDDYPDPEPVRRNDNRNEQRHFLFPPPSPGEFELTFATARVRQPSQHAFPPENNNQVPRAGPAGGAPEEPPIDDMLFAPFGFRSNAASVGGHFGGLFDIVRDLGLPNFTRFRLFGNEAGQEARAPLMPHVPQRDPPNLPFRNNLFQAPNELDWMAIPGFAQQRNEEDLEIIGQHNQKDKPIKPAREGFTRSPKSEDAIGCSNCDQELGDSDDDIKKQIWMMKCGHCYCGECANEMLSQPPPPRVQKGKRRKFSTCSITGCKATASGKKFIWEIYV
ncbi:hypothetical protein TWF694_002439 [Orbilia ellipsospora]|uniref:RING-type domain-containing protein n=1 Tax=Orbilia ellipsospora TaxID=2528407 RepID=A0AAV9X341_9PEZI